MKINVVNVKSDGKGGLEVVLPPPEELHELPLHNVAALIDKDWRTRSKAGVNFAAKPYLEAMLSLVSVEDNYGLDSGEEIVRYFLANAQSWRGPVAKAIKAELKSRLS